jgi:hypothetical protein
MLIDMRLTPGEVHAVADAASSVLPSGARVLLFGSRVHDSRHGDAPEPRWAAWRAAIGACDEPLSCTGRRLARPEIER